MPVRAPMPCAAGASIIYPEVMNVWNKYRTEHYPLIISRAMVYFEKHFPRN